MTLVPKQRTFFLNTGNHLLCVRSPAGLIISCENRSRIFYFVARGMGYRVCFHDRYFPENGT